MDISLRLEGGEAGRRTMAVYVDGLCVRSGLSEDEANRLLAQMLNQRFAAPRI